MSQRVIYPSAARTATPAAVVQQAGYLDNEQTISVVLDLTAFVTAASLTVVVDSFDRLTGKWVNVLTSAVISAISIVRVGPTAAGELMRIGVTHGNGNSHTYSVTAHLSR